MTYNVSVSQHFKRVFAVARIPLGLFLAFLRVSIVD